MNKGGRMLQRKIFDYLVNRKKSENKKPLVIKGLRQVGKTFIVKEFGKKYYKSVVYLDFRVNENLREIFDNSFIINDLVSQITANIKNARIIENDTLFIFDEVQDCPNARSSLKYFYEDGRYDVVCTGSLLGIKGYNQKGDKSIPVGYEEIVYMNSLDFEEFLWANGITDETISFCKKCFKDKVSIFNSIHDKLSELFRMYICVGGMPAVINEFLKSGDMNQVLKIQKNIIESYKDDFGRHLRSDNSLYVDEKELGVILAVFDSIPSQLAKENKKFQFSKVKSKAKNDDFKRAIERLYDAGIICKCYNLNNLELPLEGNKEDDVFKVYMSDSGLFVSLLEEGTQADILKGNMLVYKGAIYENIIADMFNKNGRKLYYYRKDSGLELDFVTRYDGSCIPIEVKATNNKSKSLSTVLNNNEKYHISFAIKLRDGNVQLLGNVLYLPHYLAFLLNSY